MVAPPLAATLSPLSPHALLGRPACYPLRKSARSFPFVARACCVCRSLQAAPLSALLLLLFFFVRSFFLQSALSRVVACGLGFGFCEIRFTRVFRFLLWSAFVSFPSSSSLCTTYSSLPRWVELLSRKNLSSF
jgi:hypothetical protein